MTLNYHAVILIWGIVIIAIVSIKPMLKLTLWYYQKRIEQEQKRQEMLIQANEKLRDLRDQLRANK